MEETLETIFTLLEGDTLVLALHPAQLTLAKNARHQESWGHVNLKLIVHQFNHQGNLLRGIVNYCKNFRKKLKIKKLQFGTIFYP